MGEGGWVGAWGWGVGVVGHPGTANLGTADVTHKAGAAAAASGGCALSGRWLPAAAVHGASGLVLPIRAEGPLRSDAERAADTEVAYGHWAALLQQCGPRHSSHLLEVHLLSSRPTRPRHPAAACR